MIHESSVNKEASTDHSFWGGFSSRGAGSLQILLKLNLLQEQLLLEMNDAFSQLDGAPGHKEKATPKCLREQNTDISITERT